MDSISSTSSITEPVQTERKIALLSTVLKLYNIRVYDQLNDWCKAFPRLEIYLLYRQRGQVQLPDCGQDRVHLILEPKEKPKSRIDRLASFRNVLRKTVAQSIVDYDTVLVADLDMYRLPTAAQLADSIERLHDNTNNPYDFLCANGFEVMAGIPQPYDLYAMVEADGRFRFGSEGLTAYWYATAQQPRLYQNIVHNDSAGDDTATTGGQYYPVQSCFSGLALYKSALYFDTRCSYTEQPVPLEEFAINGKVCEHVVLHQCMRYYYKELQSAILPELPLVRSCEAACQGLGSLYFTGVYGGSSFILFLLWRWRKQLHQGRVTGSRKIF